MRIFLKIICLISLLAAVACTPLVQNARPDIQEPVLTDGIYEAADGYDMPYRVWSAEEAEKAVIIAVHGLNDYSNAFAFPASWWMQNGITTYAYDQRGFGETDEFGIWPGEEKLINDLITFVGLVKSRHPGKPVFILGESLGGAVTMSSVVHPDMPAVAGVMSCRTNMRARLRRKCKPRHSSTAWFAAFSTRPEACPTSSTWQWT